MTETNNVVSKRNRVWELDFLRGLAVLGMVFIHMNYALKAYFNINILADVPNFEKIVLLVMNYGGNLFILISGICCCFSRNNLKRGLQLFFFAMVVTYVTAMYEHYVDPNNLYTILFGILHCLSLCMMIGHFLLKLPQKKYITNIGYTLLGILLIVAGVILKEQQINIPVICGSLVYPWFVSSDYFPLLPSLGCFILGIAVGNSFYKKGKALIPSEKVGRFPLISVVSFVGRHSLIIYLLHQPVIFGIMFLIQSF